MGSGGRGADGCRVAFTSSQRRHVQYISIVCKYLRSECWYHNILEPLLLVAKLIFQLSAKQNMHTETEAQTKTSPILPDIWDQDSEDFVMNYFLWGADIACLSI